MRLRRQWPQTRGCGSSSAGATRINGCPLRQVRLGEAAGAPASPGLPASELVAWAAAPAGEEASVPGADAPLPALAGLGLPVAPSSSSSSSSHLMPSMASILEVLQCKMLMRSKTPPNCSWASPTRPWIPSAKRSKSCSNIVTLHAIMPVPPQYISSGSHGLMVSPRPSPSSPPSAPASSSSSALATFGPKPRMVSSIRSYKSGPSSPSRRGLPAPSLPPPGSIASPQAAARAARGDDA
mmetsp:Transcript_24987/g.71801  ORF Transcript_24987/g.71801 Transcript_24987/m.71801 type:complete len:239 (-) Transcript_24987:14-730(-)